MISIQENNIMLKSAFRRWVGRTSALSMAVAIASLPVVAKAQDSKETAVTANASQSDPHQIRFRADTLVVTPVLNASMVGSVRTAVAGEKAEFQAYNNYPAFIDKGEIRIFKTGASPDSEPLTTLAVDTDGHAEWDVPSDASEALYFVYRVTSKDGKFDETVAHELTVVGREFRPETKNKVEPAIQAADEAVRRTIGLSGIMATVTGRANPETDQVRVSGQVVPVDTSGRFVAQQIVSRTKGAMDVVITRNGEDIKTVSQSFATPKDDWFVVGQGDLTLGKSYGSGPAADVSGDTLAEGSYAIGRAAFYAKGVVGDDIRVTASVDTGETLVKDLFSNIDRKDPSQLFRRLNREQYYPTYGDDSTLVEDAPTQGRFYLRVNKDASQFIVGNFTTTVNGAELAQLDRGLFGALLDYNSEATTSFGERKYQVTAFASDPGTVPGREEFRGTGGSLYFLKRQDVSIGSERVRVEVRDRETGIVLESRTLYPQQDYDFDPFQGRLMLVRPLSSTMATGGIVREGSSTGNVPVLVVRYEYSPPVGSLDGYTLGGRASGWINDKLRLGVTAQRDTLEEAAQNLIGADAMFRVAAGTYFKGEVAQTEGPGFGQSNSVDGGLSFTDIMNPGLNGVKAQAWRTELAVDVAELRKRTGDLGKFSAFFEHFDRGFSSAGHLSPAETQRWGVAAALPFGKDTQFSAKFDSLESGTAGSSETAVADLIHQMGEVKASLGLRYEDRVQGVLYNSVQQGKRTDAALQLEYKPDGDRISLYGFGQLTLDHDATRLRNNRLGAGVNAQITKRLSLESEVSGGDGGIGADVQLNHRLGEGSEAYVGYSLFADRADTGLDTQNIFTRSNRGTLTVGARHRFDDALSVYGESRTGIGGTAPSLTRSFGLRYEPTKQLSFTGSFENGKIDDATTGLFRRTAGSLGVGYVNDDIRAGSSIEFRKEDGATLNQKVWLFRNDLSYSVNPDWRFLGRLNIAWADHESPSVRAAEFTEAMAGFAYRPVNNERLNALFRLQYFEDLGPAGQVTGSGQTQSPKQVSTVASVDFNYDLTKRLTMGAKYGYRSGKVSLGRDSDVFVKSDAHLVVARADYNVVSSWDILAEGRALWVTAADDVRYGGLAALYRHLGNNVKVGVGYSWSKFSDDLTDQSYSSHGPFINLLGKF